MPGKCFGHSNFTSRDLRTLEQLFGSRRNPLVQNCFHFYIGFDHFGTHKRDEHGTPYRTTETKSRPTESAFHGTLQVFTIDGTEDNQVLMEFKLNSRNIITDFINRDVSNGAKQVQSVASLDLYKERN